MRARRAGVIQASRGGLRRGGSLILAATLFTLLLAACGSTTPTVPSSPAGMYSNATFKFSVAYPAGWLPNEIKAPLGSPQATSTAPSPIPLTVVITQTDTVDIDSALLSSFTVTVFDASNPSVASTIKAQQAQASGSNPTLKTVTLANQQAWQAAPVTQQLPDSDVSATHTDYFLLHGKYEFQVSTDSISGGGADSALASMLHSFAFTA